MKTTIELPDRLFAQVKRAALRRQTTLKALVTHALQREVGIDQDESSTVAFAIDKDGLPHLPSRGVKVTGELVNRLLQEEDT